MKTSTLVGAALAAFFIFRTGTAKAQGNDTEERAPGIAFEGEGSAGATVLPDVAYETGQGDTPMTEHFTLSEFTKSRTAQANGLDNTLPATYTENAAKTLQMLERIRAHLSYAAGADIPIYITSGYRSPEVNHAVGGASNSDHLRAQAVDWTAPDFGTPAQIAATLAPVVDDLEIGQLINEFPDSHGWVHTGTEKPANEVNRIITVTKAGTTVGVTA